MKATWLMVIAFTLPVQAFAFLNCDNIDGIIADEQQEAQNDFAEAKRMAESIGDRGTAQAAKEVIELLNPFPSIPTIESLAEEGAMQACTALLGKTVAKGVGATKLALDISLAIGNNQVGAVQGMINSLRTTGRKHIENANRAWQWKQDNCPPEDECLADPPVDDIDPPAEESPLGGETMGDGSGGSLPVFNGDDFTIEVLDEDSIRISTDCDSDDRRIQLRTTGTWSTKPLRDGHSAVVDDMVPGTRYEARSRCNRQYGGTLEFVYPDIRAPGTNIR